ncbi:TetR/AcrR family transcriptional regulator [Sinobacterium norvegicum]|uniref:TetR/AcrR family transcriptional regulator n=1 Tax=Sinobacterium norvegicum TaxID=1641715 RepID=UPI001F3C5165|nr:TetR/AcrR family transcriptional regulator [Sinobacterium norvegicum]
MRKDSLETKRLLVDAAEKLFAEQGVDNVKMVDVSQAAGQKNRNAAQYHFGSRAGLITAVLNKHGRDISADRRHRLARVVQQPCHDLQDLVAALVLPISQHVRHAENGRTYLMLNRQLINNDDHIKLVWGRMNNFDDVLQLQQMMTAKIPAHAKPVIHAKMVLIQSMLFNGLASFYDLSTQQDDSTFVATLCSSIVAVLTCDVNS